LMFDVWCFRLQVAGFRFENFYE